MLALQRLIPLLMAALCVASCGSGSGVRTLTGVIPRDSKCLIKMPLSGKRASQTVLRTQSTSCDPTQPDPLFSDLSMFQQMVDATGFGNACDAAVPRCGNPDAPANDNVIADPGGPAKRGDNCTPTNGYAIGYSLGPGTGGNTLTAPNQPIPAMNNTTTIVNQSQIYLGNFSQTTPVGFLLYTEANGTWFVPNFITGVTIGPVSGAFIVPGAYRISDNAANTRKLMNNIRGIFSLATNQSGISLASAFASALKGTGANLSNVPCNTSSLG